MNGLIIVDTDILIDAAHQISEVVDCLAKSSVSLCWLSV